MNSETLTDAFSWIMQILEEEKTHYQIVGGMAAFLHGGSRPIHDIDMYIPAEKAERVYQRVREFISKPLKRYTEEGWDIEYFQLIYSDQKIEIGRSPGWKFLSGKTNEWVNQDIDFKNFDQIKFADIVTHVMPKPVLISYKRLLDREVDRQDVADLAD